jgi:hypothetical protein
MESPQDQRTASTWPAHVVLPDGVSPDATQASSSYAVITPTFVQRWEGVAQVPEDYHFRSPATGPFKLASYRPAVFEEPTPAAGGFLTADTDHSLASAIPANSSPPIENSVLAAWHVPSPLLDTPPGPSSPERGPLPHIARLLRRRIGCDLGIGHERVMYAPQVVETATGTSSTSVLLRADRGLATPDRLELIWAAPTRGPVPESRVDILDTIFRMEVGNDNLLVMTEYTLRSLNPERNDNTTGFGDMSLGVKSTLHSSHSTTVASVFRTYLKTGPSDRGLGTGHVSLEPGFLLRHQLNEHTFFHGEAKYWLPIAGTTDVAGDVLKLGTALSTVWKETDTMALLPTLEFSSYTFLAGSATRPDGLRRRVNGEFAGELYPGLRCVHGPGNELGLLEYGIATGFVFADEGWFDSRLVFDIRFAR